MGGVQKKHGTSPCKIYHMKFGHLSHYPAAKLKDYLTTLHCVGTSLYPNPNTLYCRVDRVAERDTKIKDLEIPKGMIVAVPVYAIHHDPKIWPEPEKFNPYRFTPEEKAKRGSYDWMPFGGGPRNCLGMRLALTEIKIAVARLVQSYKFVRSGETQVREQN